MRYTSFVVRIWLPGDEIHPDQNTYRVLIEHIQSGTAARVGSLDEIQRFMQRWLIPPSSGNSRSEENENI
jgi:hypothetical protein